MQDPPAFPTIQDLNPTIAAIHNETKRVTDLLVNLPADFDPASVSILIAAAMELGELDDELQARRVRRLLWTIEDAQ